MSNIHVLRQIHQWLKSFNPAWMATVVQTWDESPFPCGSLWAWAPDFGTAGALTNAGLEYELTQQLRSGELEGPFPRLLTFNKTADQHNICQLPDNARLEIIIERLTSADLPDIENMLTWITEHQSFVREIFFDAPATLTVDYHDDMPASVLTDQSFRHTIFPASFMPAQPSGHPLNTPNQPLKIPEDPIQTNTTTNR